MKGMSLCLTGFVLSLLLSCSGGGDGTFRNSPEAEADSIEVLWARYNMRGDYDSVVMAVRPFFMKSLAVADTANVLYSGAYLVQSFVFMDMMDSLGLYLDRLAPFRSGSDNVRIKAMLDNVAGIYAVKSELDYPKALSYFYEMYQSASEGSDTVAQLIALNNIVSIFYIKSDEYGMPYARRAYALAASEGIAPQYRLPSMISMAQMSFLSGEMHEAGRYLDSADSLINRYGILCDKALVNLLHADLAVGAGSRADAERLYVEAIDLAEKTDVGVLSLLYLNYGKLCEQAGDTQKAVSLYESGLGPDVPESNLMFRGELLRRLSDLYFATGDKDKAEECTRSYYSYLDSAASRRTEQEFNALRLSYQNMEHRNVLLVKEKDLLIANRRAVVAGLVAALVLVAGSLLYIMYRRQKRMYSTLVDRYQDSMKRLRGSSELNSAAAVKSQEAERSLFLRLEELMKEEKVFLKNDMTLDRLAEIMGTNRTYLSKAVNRYSGMTFLNYVNMYRINEATRIISDPSRDILVKELADYVGYNSVNVFSKAFQKETGLTPSQYRKTVLSAANK